MKTPWYVRHVACLLRKSHSSEVIYSAHPYVICVPSYSAMNHGQLARATRINLANALCFWRTAPNAQKPLIVFGNCAHAFPEAAKYEAKLKHEMCEKAGAQYIDVGDITNSVNEMDAWKTQLMARGISVEKGILICTCDLHSKAEYVLAGIIFPKAKIYLYAASFFCEVESDHPTDDQTSWSRWTICSIKRYLAFQFARMLPCYDQKVFLDILRKMTHKPGKIKLREPYAA